MSNGPRPRKPPLPAPVPDQVDITTLDVQELKALAYDQLAIIEQAQGNLRAINEQIGKVSQIPLDTLRGVMPDS